MLRPSIEAEDSTEDEVSGISGSRHLSDSFIQNATSFPYTCDSGTTAQEGTKPARQHRRDRKHKLEPLNFSVTDTIVFVRAATSVYLHVLTMKQSDIAIKKTLIATVEIVKIFGIKIFLSALGETLQHWMRIIVEHCGARRAEVRVEAADFLNLLLRLTWDSYGSFFRVRLPLLAIQSEVMERIVAKAATRYVLEQRRNRFNPITLSNEAAEASLAPMWRTIDRLHNKSASQNISFKSALARLAIRMKTLFKAYLAAHALAIVNRTEPSKPGESSGDTSAPQTNAYVQRIRVSVHRIISESTGSISKQFLGNQASSSPTRALIQNEAVEDAFLAAADVFSSTELPSHRIAWLQKLAVFYRMRVRFAEEATCRFCIYTTYREAAKLMDNIWNSSPFLPWANDCLEGIHPRGEGPAGEANLLDESENFSVDSGKPTDKDETFRRIFYRAADSVRMGTGDCDIGGNIYLFFGVTLKSEYDSSSVWYSLREMEDNMLEEAETSGDLFLKAGIVESSRYTWSLVTQVCSETFNYARLADVYKRLILCVPSSVPKILDTAGWIDFSSRLGRFYKVYFHGSAPDELNGIEFVYRTRDEVNGREFVKRLETAVRSILPNKSTIYLVLDDGSPNQLLPTKKTATRAGAPIEPIRIKVTPLRPLFKVEGNTEKGFRGSPEWFYLRAENSEVDDGPGEEEHARSRMHQRQQSISTSNTFNSASSSSRRPNSKTKYRVSRLISDGPRNESPKNGQNTQLVGVDTFYFTQPDTRDPTKGFRDFLKVSIDQFAERSLRVTELQVEKKFPACVTRQKNYPSFSLQAEST